MTNSVLARASTTTTSLLLHVRSPHLPVLHGDDVARLAPSSPSRGTTRDVELTCTRLLGNGGARGRHLIIPRLARNVMGYRHLQGHSLIGGTPQLTERCRELGGITLLRGAQSVGRTLTRRNRPLVHALGPAAGGLKMADIPPNADTTTERNHSRDGGEDQQQRAVLPPSPPDSRLATNGCGWTHYV